MPTALERFLDQVADRNAHVGGGSLAALSAAMSAALLEKLPGTSAQSTRLRRIRSECTKLILEDGIAFARVLQADRVRNPQGFSRRLKSAIEIPCRIAQDAHGLVIMGRRARRRVKRPWRSDAQCALALAVAAEASACAMIHANLRWLHDSTYTRRIRRRLRWSHHLPLAQRAKSAKGGLRPWRKRQVVGWPPMPRRAA